MGKKSKAPPAPVDPLQSSGQQSRQLLKYYRTQVPQWLQLQNRFGPQFMAQMLGQTGQVLGGVGGKPGLQALQLSSGQEAGRTLGQLRAEELQQMTGQTGLTRDLMAALSPEQAAQVAASAQEAERARASAQGVTPEEQRMYQQTAREAAQASGRVGGNYAISSEIMGRENIMAAKRAEAARAGQQAYSLAGGFYTSPGLAALQSAPLSYGDCLNTLGTALNLGPSSSGSFDYNMPLGFAKERAGALDAYNMEKYKADQERRAGIMNLLGKATSLGSAVMTGGASMGLGSLMTSMGGGMGSTGLFNAGANLFNMGAGAGTPLKATIV